MDSEEQEIIIGKKQVAKLSMKPKGCAVQISDSPLVSGAKTKPSSIQVEEIDDLVLNVRGMTMA